jgi:hypothetical protein
MSWRALRLGVVVPALTLAACGPMPAASPSALAQLLSPSPQTSQSPATPGATPDPTPIAATVCPDTPGGQTLTNTAYRFEFRLPATWRPLRAGDSAWTTVYGAAGKGVEAQVAQTTIEHFAIPYPAADAREASLSVYVRRSEAGASTGSFALDYWTFLTGAPVTADWPDASVKAETVILNPGAALRLTTTFAGATPLSSAAPPTAVLGDHVVVYILQHDSRGYFFVFRGTERALAARSEEMRCVVGSLHYKK